MLKQLKHLPYISMAGLPGILGPLRWQDDVTGVLPEAVHTFFGVQGCKPLTSERLDLLREYAEYYINAPCWLIDGNEAIWTQLREEIQHITTRDALEAWLMKALYVTIDPF